MRIQKYRCKICGQLITPNPDHTCPLCGAPKEFLIPIRDKDDDENEAQKRR